jgi:hypothetical protein
MSDEVYPQECFDCESTEIAWFIKGKAWCAECAFVRFEITEEKQ